MSNEKKGHEHDKTEYNKVDQKEIKDDIQEEEKEVREKKQKIVSTTPKEHKKGLMERLVTGLVGPDGVRGIGSYVGRDIIVPAIKNIIADSVTSGINMMMFGETGGPSRGYRGPSGYSTPNRQPRTNYANRYSPTQYQGTNERPDTSVKRSRMGMLEERVIEYREEALDVLGQLQHDADIYGVASVADYYDMIGVNTSFTHNTYGWTIDVLKHVNIRPVRGGYILQLPTPVHIG